MTGFEIYIVIITSQLFLGLPVALLCSGRLPKLIMYFWFSLMSWHSILMGQLTAAPGNHFPLPSPYCCCPCSNILNS